MGYHLTAKPADVRESGNAHGRFARVGSGYRFYSPELGRWVNRDPIEEMGSLTLSSERRIFFRTSGILGGIVMQPEMSRKLGSAAVRRSRSESTGANKNLYLFVQNDPVAVIDPDGLGWLAWFVQLLAELAPIAEDVALSSEGNERTKGENKCSEQMEPAGGCCCVLSISRRVAGTDWGLVRYRYKLLKASVESKPCDEVALPSASIGPPGTEYLDILIDW